MFSDDYGRLLNRVKYLDRTFVPPKNKEQTFWGQDKLRAYRLLAHAEIEYYIEQAAQRLLDELELSLASKNRASRMERIWGEKVLAQQKNAIGNNHGIKRANLLDLFYPLGISAIDFDTISSTFLDRMDELAKFRGHDAHKGIHDRATKTLNGRVIKEHINEVVEGLHVLDIMVAKLRLRHFFD